MAGAGTGKTSTLVERCLDCLLSEQPKVSLDEILMVTVTAEAVQELIEVQGNGRDQSIRRLILRLHHYTETRPDPAGWLKAELERLADPRPVVWESWLREGFFEWVESSVEMLEGGAEENEI